MALVCTRSITVTVSKLSENMSEVLTDGLLSLEKKIRSNSVVCQRSLAAQFPRLPTLTAMVCCKLKIHLACLSNFSTCPCCSQPYQLLPCCVCRGTIEVWLKYRHNRNKCCGADMHESCWKDHFLIYYNRCPIRQVLLKQGSQILKILKRWILFTCVLNKTKIMNFGAKINITLCHPLC